MLRASNLSLRLGGHKILDGVSLTLEKGKYTTLIGPNGSGKTTLIRVLSGLSRPDAGEVALENQNLFSLSAAERARRIAVVQQHEYQGMPFTSLDLVLMGLNPWRARGAVTTQKDVRLCEEWMEKTGTLAFASRRVDTLSGGEFQRLTLARALVQKPRLLFLDEAMSEMDVCARFQMHRLIADEIRESGLTVAAIHHDLSTAYRFSDRMVVLSHGRVAKAGDAESALDAQCLLDVFGVKADLFPGKGLMVLDARDKYFHKGEQL